MKKKSQENNNKHLNLQLCIPSLSRASPTFSLSFLKCFLLTLSVEDRKQFMKELLQRLKQNTALNLLRIRLLSISTTNCLEDRKKVFDNFIQTCFSMNPQNQEQEQEKELPTKATISSSQPNQSISNSVTTN
jgi:hypothetical protein